MANIKKSFNFRNGVQVDDDNLKVSATGLVGIGTTVPTESLDVRGNLVISGVTSSPTVQAGVLTVTTLNPTEIIGAGISIKSGIVTASSGIITFYGDGINLLNLPTSQWEDTIVGSGVSSIYNTGGNVGIATTAALFTLQVGNDANSGQKGVGISSFGDIKASGITTASGFVGPLTGDVTGNVTGNIIGDITGNIVGPSTVSNTNESNNPNEGALQIAGGLGVVKNIQTSGGLFVTGTGGLNVTHSADINGDLDVDGHTNLDNVSIAGVVTATTFVGNGDFVDIDVDGHTNLDNLNIAGVTTFAGRIEGSSTNNIIPFLYSDLASLPSASTYHGAFAHVHATGKGYFAHANQWWELVSKESDGRIGNGSEDFNANYVGSATTIHATKLGVGTTEAPANDIQVRNSGNAEIQVTSDTGIAGLTVGRESGTSNTNNAEFRYGGGAGASYSSNQSLDIINYGTGNFNYHLSAANAGNVDGDFHWHKGVNTSRLMTLTGIGGSLGIGITTPDSTLHVLGQAKISGNVVLGGDLDVTGNAALNVVGRVTGDLVGNVFANSGVSTFKRLDLDTSSYYEFGQLSATGVGIGTTMGSFKLAVNDDADKKFFITDSGNVGIKTISNNGNALFVNGAVVALDPIGIGTDEPRAAVDFADAGQATTGLAANRMYMIPPKVGAGQTAGLVGLVAGAMIYNTTLNKLQVYNGTNWETITSA